MPTTTQPSAAAPAPIPPVTLPTWSIGIATGILFRNGEKAINGRAYHELIAQANVAGQLLAALQTAYAQAINRGTDFPYNAAFLAIDAATKGEGVRK